VIFSKMPGRAYKKPVSKAQARFFGFAAGGGVPGFKASDARRKLRGTKLKRLPARTRRRR